MSSQSSLLHVAAFPLIGKSASQSTNYIYADRYPPGNAVDGDISTFSHTAGKSKTDTEVSYKNLNPKRFC